MEKSQRIAISHVAMNGVNNEIQVELSYGGSLYQGRAIGGKDETAQMLAATNALIEAVNSIIPTPLVKRVTEIHQIKFKDLNEPVVVVLVAVNIRGQEMLYPGAARFNGTALNGAVRATLDAVNRPTGLVL
jgi:hypothetical protein